MNRKLANITEYILVGVNNLILLEYFCFESENLILIVCKYFCQNKALLLSTAHVSYSETDLTKEESHFSKCL